MKKRYDVISGLKFFYILTIFLSHLNVILLTDFWKKIYVYISSGAYGVSFFFVVSGFFMYLNYYDRFGELNKKKIFIYLEKKIKKLYPMYAITMLVFIIMELRDILISGAFTWEYMKDFIFRVLLSTVMLQALSIKTTVSQTFNGAAWFLSCLMIIYVATPFIFWLLQKVKDKIISNGILLFAICFSLCAYFNYLWMKYPQESGIFYCSVYTRVFHYLLGVSVGMIFKNNTLSVGKRFFDICEAVLIIINLYAWLIRKWGIVSSYTMQLLAAAITVFVFAFEKGFISRLIKNSNIGKLESMYFNFYLLHYMVISMISRYYIPKVVYMTNMHMLLLCIFALGLSCMLSYFSVRLIHTRG